MVKVHLGVPHAFRYEAQENVTCVLQADATFQHTKEHLTGELPT